MKETKATAKKGGEIGGGIRWGIRAIFCFCSSAAAWQLVAMHALTESNRIGRNQKAGGTWADALFKALSSNLCKHGISGSIYNKFPSQRSRILDKELHI